MAFDITRTRSFSTAPKVQPQFPIPEKKKEESIVNNTQELTAEETQQISIEKLKKIATDIVPKNPVDSKNLAVRSIRSATCQLPPVDNRSLRTSFQTPWTSIDEVKKEMESTDADSKNGSLKQTEETERNLQAFKKSAEVIVPKNPRAPLTTIENSKNTIGRNRSYTISQLPKVEDSSPRSSLTTVTPRTSLEKTSTEEELETQVKVRTLSGGC